MTETPAALASLSAVRNTEWAEKKVKTVAQVFLKTKTKTFMTVPKCVIDMVEKRTI